MSSAPPIFPILYVSITNFTNFIYILYHRTKIFPAEVFLSYTPRDIYKVKINARDVNDDIIQKFDSQKGIEQNVFGDWCRRNTIKKILWSRQISWHFTMTNRTTRDMLWSQIFHSLVPSRSFHVQRNDFTPPLVIGIDGSTIFYSATCFENFNAIFIFLL